MFVCKAFVLLGALTLHVLPNPPALQSVTTSVDATLDAQMAKQLDQTAAIAKRKSVDKVLRQVLNDVIQIEDTLRDLDPSRVGASRCVLVGRLLHSEGSLAPARWTGPTQPSSMFFFFFGGFYNAAKTRMKKVGKPLSKLESDLGRLTSALTSEGDTADAAGLQRPLFNLCPDGYLLCDSP